MKKTIPLFSLLAWLLPALTTIAAPSGGPYGPRHLSYEVPGDASRVIFVSPEGDTSASGASIAEPTSIEKAIAKATTGTVIVLRGGIYRTGDNITNQGITLQPYLEEKPILKGTKVAEGWEPLRSGYWRIRWQTLFPDKAADWWRRNREGMFTPPWFFNNDMVFRDGELLQPRGWEGDLDANSYTIDYEQGYVYIRFDPTPHLMEITAWDGCIIRTMDTIEGRPNDGMGLIMRGITMTQYAYRAIEIEGIEPEGPMEPGTYGRDIVGSQFEDVTFSFCSRVAGYFRGDEMIFRHCLIADNGTEGIYIINSSHCLLERNIVTRTNIEPITGYYASAVKIFNQSHHVVVRDNLIIDNPNASGVWWDVGNNHAVFINNWVENTDNGFFFEISQMAICAGNVFVNCDKGVWILNARDAEIYQNTFINSSLAIDRTPRSAVGDHFGWHPATGPDVHERVGHVIANNLFVTDPTFRKPVIAIGQSESLCGTLTDSQLASMHSNVLVREQGGNAAPLLSIAPVAGADKCTRTYATLDAFKADFPDFVNHTSMNGNIHGPILKNLRLRNLSLIPCFKGNPPVDTLPAHVRGLLELPANTPLRAGAYTDGTM
jgi:hypothetical protein